MFKYPYDVVGKSNLVSQFLSKDLTAQDQALANINVIGDYSSALDDFIIGPATGYVYELHKMIVSVRDAGTFASDKYGVDVVLTNGIKVFTRSGNTGAKTYLNTQAVKVNPDWEIYTYSLALSAYTAGNETLNADWKFTEGGTPLWLLGSTVDQLGIEVNDDFSDLVSHFFFVQGIKHVQR